MNFAGLDFRIDALSEQLASARKEDEAQRVADELAHFIWVRAEMARKIVQVGALAHETAGFFDAMREYGKAP
jgi:phosphatidylglycerophosphatase A